MYSGIDRGASMEHPMKRSSLVMCDGVRRAVSGSAAGIGRRAPADRGSRSPPLGGRVIQPTACPAVNRSRAHASTASPVRPRIPSSGQSITPAPRAPNRADAVPAKEPPPRRASVSSTRRSASSRSIGRAPRCAQTPERTASTSLRVPLA